MKQFFDFGPDGVAVDVYAPRVCLLLPLCCVRGSTMPLVRVYESEIHRRGDGDGYHQLDKAIMHMPSPAEVRTDVYGLMTFVTAPMHILDMVSFDAAQSEAARTPRRQGDGGGFMVKAGASGRESVCVE